MKRKSLYFLLIAMVPLLIMTAVMQLNRLYAGVFDAGSLHFVSIIGFIFFYCYTLIILTVNRQNLNSLLILFFILAGASVPQAAIRITDFNGGLNSLFDFIIQLSGILFAYFCFRLPKRHWLAYMVVCIFCGIWLSVTGNEMWLNHLNFGTLTGKIDNAASCDFSFMTKQGDTISLQSFKNKYLLLNFWTTQCEVSCKEMREAESLYSLYYNNPQITVYAVHSRIENKNENHTTGAEILNKNGYRIPCVSIDKTDPVLFELAVNSYPTVLIFGHNNNLVFRGNAKYAAKFLGKILK